MDEQGESFYSKKIILTAEEYKFIADSAQKMIESKDEKSIFSLIKNSCKILFPGCITVITKTLENSTKLEVIDYCGIENSKFMKIIKLLGFNPIGKIFNAEKAIEKKYSKSKIYSHKEKLSELAKDKVPKPFLKIVEKMFDIENVYTIGITDGLLSFGNVYILANPKIKLKINLIKSFFYQCFMAFKNAMLFSKVSESAEEYSTLLNNLLESVVIIGQKGELLFNNKSAVKMFELKEDNLPSSVLEFVSEESKKDVINDILDVFSGKGNKISEYRVFSAKGKKMWVEGIGKKIKYKNNDADMISLRDITEKKQTEEEVKKRLETEKTISLISSEFMHEKNINNAINNSLKIIGKFIGVQRTYIFLLNKNNNLTNTNEWIEKGMPSQMNEFKDVPIDTFPLLKKMIYSKGFANITSIDLLPEYAKAEKNIMNTQNLSSFFMTSIKSENELIGILGFDCIDFKFKFDEFYIPFMKIISEMIGNAIKRDMSQMEIKEKADFVSTLINTIPFPVYYKDINGNYLGCNDEFERFVGVKRKNILGKDVYSASPKNLADYYKKKDAELLKNPGKQIYNYTVKSSKGIRDVIFHKATFTDRKGKITGIIGAVIDVTASKKMEDNLIAYKNRLDSILFSKDYAWWEMDCKNGDIIFSEQKAKILGYSPEDFKKYDDFVKLAEKSDAEIMNNAIKNISKSNDFYEIQYKLMSKKGNYLWFHEIGKAEFDEKGKPSKITGIVENITEKKEAEQLIIKKKEETEMIKLKNQLLMRVSHELRHPLVPIVGYSSVMLDENPSEIQKKYLEKIIENSVLLKNLINNVLEVISFETGEARINPTKFMLGDLIDEIISELRTKAELKSIKIVKQVKNNKNVFLDRNKIKLSISNVIDNAIKYTESGQVKISVSIGKEIEIIISDTGIGMSKEKLENLFSPKYDYSDVSAASGLGLGLILTNYIIKAHKGVLIIKSVEKKGTTVKMIIPLVKK